MWFWLLVFLVAPSLITYADSKRVSICIYIYIYIVFKNDVIVFLCVFFILVRMEQNTRNKNVANQLARDVIKT